MPSANVKCAIEKYDFEQKSFSYYLELEFNGVPILVPTTPEQIHALISGDTSALGNPAQPINGASIPSGDMEPEPEPEPEIALLDEEDMSVPPFGNKIVERSPAEAPSKEEKLQKARERARKKKALPPKGAPADEAGYPILGGGRVVAVAAAPSDVDEEGFSSA